MAICIVCKKKVTPKTGIQCQGSCSVWVHYGCLDYVTDDGHKMVHEPFERSHMYSDVCVVTQLNDNDKKQNWNNNYDSLSDQYVNMNETASQVTHETATKSVSQGASIYKSLSLRMCSSANTEFYARPIEYIPCGNVPHILLPTPYPIQFLPNAIQYGENTKNLDAVNARRLGYNRIIPNNEKPQGERFYPKSIATETDDFNIAPLDSTKRNYPAVSYKKPNSLSKSNINEFDFLHKKQHHVSYHSRVPLFHFKSPTLTHASTEPIDFEYFNPYNYSDYVNSDQRKSHLYDSKSITTVAATEPYENVYGRTLLSTMNPLGLSEGFDETLLNSSDLAALNAIKYNISGMHKWMSSSKLNKKKESDTRKNDCCAIADRRGPIDPLQGSELTDIIEKSITAEIKVSIKQSKSVPHSASPQATLPADHLKMNKSIAVVTDKMVENVPIAAECQTSKIKSFSTTKDYVIKSTNTSVEKSVAIRISKSVGSYNSNFYQSVNSKISSNMVKKETEINNSWENKDPPSCPPLPHAKCKVEKNKKCKKLSPRCCVKNTDAVDIDEKIEKSHYKKSENLSEGHIYSWTKLDASKLPETVSKEQLNKIFGKLLPEEIEEASSDNILTSCVKNVLSTFELLSSQICDIFYSRKKEQLVNYCSTVGSEGVINIVHKTNTTSNVFEKKQDCLTVKLLTFRND